MCIKFKKFHILTFKMNIDAENDARFQNFTTFEVSLRYQQLENEVAGEHVNYVISMVVASESLKLTNDTIENGSKLKLSKYTCVYCPYRWSMRSVTTLCQTTFLSSRCLTGVHLELGQVANVTFRQEIPSLALLADTGEIPVGP